MVAQSLGQADSLDVIRPWFSRSLPDLAQAYSLAAFARIRLEGEDSGAALDLALDASDLVASW